MHIVFVKQMNMYYAFLVESYNSTQSSAKVVKKVGQWPIDVKNMGPLSRLKGPMNIN